MPNITRLDEEKYLLPYQVSRNFYISTNSVCISFSFCVFDELFFSYVSKCDSHEREISLYKQGGK